MGCQKGARLKSEMGSFPFTPNQEGAFLDRGMPPFSFHLMNVYPVRNDAPLEFLTGFTSPLS